jgi:hypothetical protein
LRKFPKNILRAPLASKIQNGKTMWSRRATPSFPPHPKNSRRPGQKQTKTKANFKRALELSRELPLPRHVTDPRAPLPGTAGFCHVDRSQPSIGSPPHLSLSPRTQIKHPPPPKRVKIVKKRSEPILLHFLSTLFQILPPPKKFFCPHRFLPPRPRLCRRAVVVAMDAEDAAKLPPYQEVSVPSRSCHFFYFFGSWAWLGARICSSVGSS